MPEQVIAASAKRRPKPSFRRALARVVKALPEWPGNPKLLLSIHDEIVLEAAQEHAEEVGRLLRAEMLAENPLSVRIDATPAVGKTWDDLK